MRPYLLYLSGVAGLSGLAICLEEGPLSPAFWTAFLAMFLGYGFGQALTDCFQIDTDAISAPYRPLCKGEISRMSLGLVSLIGLILIGLTLGKLNVHNLLLISLSIVGLSSYTWFKKHLWYAGPPFNAFIFMLLPVMGYLALSDNGFEVLLNSELRLTAGLSYFSYVNFVLIGYLKDLKADRETGYRTFPLRFGWNATIWLGNIHLLIVVWICLQLIDFTNLVATGLFIVSTVIALSAQVYGLVTKNKSESNARFPISATVRSLVLWHLSVVVSYQNNWLTGILLFYFLFEVNMYFRPKRNQI